LVTTPSERGHRSRHLVEQRADQRGILDIARRHCGGDDLFHVGGHGNMGLPPGTACIHAVFLDQVHRWGANAGAGPPLPDVQRLCHKHRSRDITYFVIQIVRFATQQCRRDDNRPIPTRDAAPADLVVLLNASRWVNTRSRV
jgi:hypothetical protein